jgi:hypothetical protein
VITKGAFRSLNTDTTINSGVLNTPMGHLMKMRHILKDDSQTNIYTFKKQRKVEI